MLMNEWINEKIIKSSDMSVPRYGAEKNFVVEKWKNIERGRYLWLNPECTWHWVMWGQWGEGKVERGKSGAAIKRSKSKKEVNNQSSWII